MSLFLRIGTHLGFPGSHSSPFDTRFTQTRLREASCVEFILHKPPGGSEMRFAAAILATTAAAFALAATAGAATIAVSIKSTGFSPATITINHGDSVTWKNSDKADHQVVADDGSFASPILHAGHSYTATFSRAGSFRYHDSFAASHAGRVNVKGPPPSVTFALSAPIVNYGTTVMLSG